MSETSTQAKPKKASLQSLLDDIPELEGEDFDPSFRILESDSGFGSSCDTFSVGLDS
jgi:hypothetical protein